MRLFILVTIFVAVASVSSKASPSHDKPIEKSKIYLHNDDTTSALNVGLNMEQSQNLPAMERRSRIRKKSSSCGVANRNRISPGVKNNRIVGGEEAIPNEFPWQALLQVEMQGGNAYACGGSLISDQWILTAAHCLVVPGQTVNYVDIYLGKHDRTVSEDNQKLYSSSESFIHPDWNPTTQAGDIALIKLKSSVKFSQYISPICLASTSEPDYVNSSVTVTGWGITYDGSPTMSPVLYKMTVPVISNDECSGIYGSNVITDAIICTSGDSSSGTCIGDSGGPMNFQQSDGTWKQIGIIAFGSGQGCQKGHPSGFTRISSYSSWIEDIMNTSNSAGIPMPSVFSLFLFAVNFAISFQISF
ncbi:brachyurin-like [Daphnia carinata]|uniref:brachyurin-like n=1 Tax=Daphnia carinata TaxID=120202 RepID=UPI00257B8B2D|nr:brachyurin-like [Daphnia carinata]